MSGEQNNENSPFSNEKLAEAIYDIRDRVIRVEERQQRTEIIESRANEAHEMARTANAKADENTKDIDGIRGMAKWAIGTFVVFTGVVTTALSVLLT